MYSERLLDHCLWNGSNHLLLYGMGTNEINLRCFIRSSISWRRYRCLLRHRHRHHHLCWCIFSHSQVSNVWKRILYAKICALWVCVDTKTLMFIMWCALKPFDSKVYWNNINLFAQLTFLLIQNTYTFIVSANLKFILLLLLFKRSSFHFSTLSRELFSIILFCVCVFVCRFYSLCGGMNITHIYLAICEIPMTTTEMKRKLCDTKT